MLKKLNQILNIVVGSFFGVFLGHGIYVFQDYKSHPGLYEMQSSPWYASILVYGAVFIAVLLAAIAVKLIIKKRL